MNPQLLVAVAAIAAAVLYASKAKGAGAPPAPGGQRRPGQQPQPGPAVQAPVSQSSAGSAPPALVLANAAIQNADKIGEGLGSLSDAARAWFNSPPPGGASSGDDDDTAAEDDDGEVASVEQFHIGGGGVRTYTNPETGEETEVFLSQALPRGGDELASIWDS